MATTNNQFTEAAKFIDLLTDGLLDKVGSGDEAGLKEAKAAYHSAIHMLEVLGLGLNCDGSGKSFIYQM